MKNMFFSKAGKKKERMRSINRIYSAVSVSVVAAVALISVTLMCILPAYHTDAARDDIFDTEADSGDTSHISADTISGRYDLGEVIINTKVVMGSEDTDITGDADLNNDTSSETSSDTEAAYLGITVVYGNNESVCYMISGTVSDALAKLGITLGEYDEMNFLMTDELYDGMEIVIRRIEYVSETRIETIPYNTVYEDVQTVPVGEKVLKTQGADGKIEKVLSNKYVNGELESSTLISETVISRKTDEVYRRGVGGTITGSDGTVYRFSHYIDCVATAYKAEGNTYSGTQARDGVVAVDPSVISLGTSVYIKSNYADYGVYVAEDTGKHIVNNRIDMCMSGDTDSLMQFGRRNVRVYVLY